MTLDPRHGVDAQALDAHDGHVPRQDGTVTIETDLFEHRRVQPHFINPCCFGEDFALWLKRELGRAPELSLGPGLEISDPVQEDYGWGLWARQDRDRYWIALSYAGDGPQEDPAQWTVSVDAAGLNPLGRLFHKPPALRPLRDAVRRVLTDAPAITLLD